LGGLANVFCLGFEFDALEVFGMVREPLLDQPTPDPNTPEGRATIEKTKRFMQELGEFISMFTGMEAVLFSLLGTLAQVPPAIARALFADARIDTAMTSIRRVLAARQKIVGKTEFETRLEAVIIPVLEQTAVINSVRNHIIHHGMAGSPVDAPIASNWARARSPDQIVEIPLSAESLKDMTSDIGRSFGIVTYVVMALTPNFPKSGDEITLAEKMLREKPWLYKSPLQGGKKGKTSNKTPK